MWQKYDTSRLYDLKQWYMSFLSFSLQDSMDEACAERIGDEHYRLEGRLSADLNENLQTHVHKCSAYVVLFCRGSSFPLHSTPTL